MKSKQDRSGNFIGDGSWNVDYTLFDFTDYPQINNSVSKSETTESVYVTYYNKDNNNSITLRFSEHDNNAVKFGDQLNGYFASKNEILAHLGLMKRTFVPIKKAFIKSQMVSKKNINKYEFADKTISEMYAMGVGADISKYNGKIAKGSNYLINDNFVGEYTKQRKNAFGDFVDIGNYIYEKMVYGGNITNFEYTIGGL
jgi:hypothetical protein